MKTLKVIAILILAATQQFHAQQSANKKEIIDLINVYSESVIKKDSVAFYNLFNPGTITWCASVKERSQAKEIEKGAKARDSYFTGSYQGFMRGLYKYESTEDKFDNIKITEDGTVASVTMDYSFWANNKMTNWGGKYLTLIKRDGKWKITSVIYSLELTAYYQQPSLKERQKQKGN